MADLKKLLQSEKFELIEKDGVTMVLAYGALFPVAHPFAIYCKLYRDETNPELKFTFMKKVHDMLWPQDIVTWHTWTEDRFRVYCEGWRIISWASGASGGKSVDAAKIILMEWIAAPKTTAAVIASTTLNSLQHRIYGYALSYLREAQIKVPYILLRSQPPQILYNRDDEIHGISALAAAKGTDRESIKNYIGRHPKGKFILALDEAPDLDTVILEALPNLEAGKDGSFQCIVIGNSSTKNDLHGALSTPKDGWTSVDPKKDSKWETTQRGGICMYFSPYTSPAIYETDPVKKAAISKFLPTTAQIEEKKKTYGENSDAFFRFVLGYWKSDSSDETILSSQFIREFGVRNLAEWSGYYPLNVVAGLDPAFSTGGDQVVLRFAVLGQTTSGKIMLDFRREEILFKLRLLATIGKSPELQIAEWVIQKLNEFNCPLSNLCIDATGQGRALGELIRQKARVVDMPIKIYSVKIGSGNQKAFDIIIKSTLELWTDLRDFIQTDSLRGLDETTIMQLTSRMIILSGQKRALESKKDYKTRMGAVSPSLAHSPDEADSASLVLQAAKIKFGFYPGQARDIQKINSLETEKYLLTQRQREKEIKETVWAGPSMDFSPVGDLGAGLVGGYRKFN